MNNRILAIVIGASEEEKSQLNESFYLTDIEQRFLTNDVKAINSFIKKQSNYESITAPSTVVIINGEIVNAKEILSTLRKSPYTRFSNIFVYGETNSYSKIKSFEKLGADFCFRKLDHWALQAEVVCNVWTKARISYCFI